MQLVVFLALVVYLSSAICLGESIQALEKHYNQPLTTRYLMMGSAALLIPLAELLTLADHSPSRRAGLWYRHRSKKHLVCSGVVAGLTLAGGLTFIYALEAASVTMVNALTRVKPVVIYGLSVPLLREPVVRTSIAALMLSLAAASLFLVGSQLQKDHESGTQETTHGVLLGCITPVFWAVSDVFFSWAASDLFTQTQLLRDSMHFQGLTGLWTVAFFWPVCLAVEGVAIPSAEAVPMLLLAVFSMVVCNLSISFGITKSSPFVMGVGGMMTVPISFGVDHWLHNYVPSSYTIAGAVCVFVGFLMLQIKHFKRCSQLDQDDLEDSENTKIGDKLLGDESIASPGNSSIASPGNSSMASPGNNSMASHGKSSSASNNNTCSLDCSEIRSGKTFDKDPV